MADVSAGREQLALQLASFCLPGCCRGLARESVVSACSGGEGATHQQADLVGLPSCRVSAGFGKPLRRLWLPSHRSLTPR